MSEDPTPKEPRQREIRKLSIRGGLRVGPSASKVRGNLGAQGEDGDSAGLGPFADVVETRITDEVQVDATRGQAAEGAAETVEGSADSVVELELEGGIVWWTTVGELGEFLADCASGDGRGKKETLLESKTLTVPPFLPFGTRGRAAGGLLLRVLRRFDVRVPGADADPPESVARQLARRLEDRLEPGPGLYPCPRPDALGERVEDASEIAGAGPLLVLLHGTASSTAGSFGAYATDDRLPDWQRLKARYDGRVFAFQHRSLSESPAENALELARLLPADTEVHLVSHSRGGLIGELLCRSGFDSRASFSDADLELFADEGRRRDREALRHLRQVLEAKAPRIERFVRVACPARGTLLASNRLDRYLSLMLNALGLAPGVRDSPAYQFLKALLIGLARTRANPSVLPGLEAMMPGSPLIRLLNLHEENSDTDLTVIAGDVEGSGLLGRLKIFATDLFFRRDHDLVVDSAAMFGGTLRSSQRARFFFERGSGTSHFNYFENASTSGLVVKALEAEGRKIDGFETLEVGRPPEEVRGITAKGVVDPGRLEELELHRPVVVLLPGIMGSRLRVDDNVIWADVSDLLKGRFSALAYREEGDAVHPAGLLKRGYGDLAHFLAASHEVVPFAFDWRRSLDEAADRLAELLKDLLLQRTGQPIRLLAHSMGGLVARRMRSLHRTLWERLKERTGFRLVMLGTPNGGSHSIAGILLGREKILRLLTLVGNTEETRGIVGSFPGIFAMLPPRADALTEDPEARKASEDLYEASTWRDWRGIDDKVFVPGEGVLTGAKKVRAQLDGETLDDEAIFYVAGQSAKGTPAAIRRGEDGFGRPRLELILSPRGDGRVLWDTGIPKALREGGRVWFAADVSHGALANEERIFPAIRDLLDQGRTGKLRQEAPQLRGLPEGARAFEEPVLLPDDEELVAAALGYDPRPPGEARGVEVLKVSVSHGSLSYASGPVAVGHYERDAIVGAEAYLDDYLGHALRERYELGLYPGPEGTGEAILDLRDPTRGALVVGLGPVGSLAPAKISRGLRQAVLRYASLVAGFEEWADTDESGRRRITVSSLLIGTGQGTGLFVDDALKALIEGTLDAGKLLHKVFGAGAPYVERLEFIELYEHRAVCAGEALQRLVPVLQAASGVMLEVAPVLRQVEGAQSDIPCGDAAWYRRLQIVQEEPAEGTGEGPSEFRALKFTSLNERARAEVRMLPTQRRLVERFVQHSIRSSAWRPSAARTLFELLVPNQLKEYAPEELDLLLILDRHSASYPWELISDDLGDREPLAVRTGMLRQLATGTFREGPITSLENNALVIGDPPLDGTGFQPLPGARQEAETVSAELRGRGWEVEPQIGTEPQSIIEALFARPYRLLHIAAHGVYDRLHPEASGVVLGDGMLLTAAEIGQLRQVPELAFINCCHLGRIEEPPEEAVAYRNRIAANLGLELIQIGVRAVVVAGWVVNDAAADTFARTFYDQLLGGQDFGTAVKQARQVTYRYHPKTNTWGAYQCYGDPSYRPADPSGGSRSGDWNWVSPVRPVHALRNIRSRARTGSRTEKLRREVDDLETALAERYPTWMQLGQVREALGRAWAELADLGAWGAEEVERGFAPAPGGEEQSRELRAYDKAVEHLRAALRCEDGEVGFNVRGEVANLQVRQITIAWRLQGRRLVLRRQELEKEQRTLGAKLPSADADRRRELEQRLEEIGEELASGSLAGTAEDEETRTRIEGLFKDLKRYAESDPTTRRWTMVGSAAKRLAAVCAEVREEYLKQAIDAYYRADQISQDICGCIAPYPAGNWAMLKVVMALAKGRGREKWTPVEELLVKLEVPRQETNFWDRLVSVRVGLVRALMDSFEGGQVELADIQKAVQQASRQGPSNYQFALLLESLDSLSDLLDDRWKPSDAGAQRLGAARRLVLQVRAELATRVGASRRGA